MPDDEHKAIPPKGQVAGSPGTEESLPTEFDDLLRKVRYWSSASSWQAVLNKIARIDQARTNAEVLERGQAAFSMQEGSTHTASGIESERQRKIAVSDLTEVVELFNHYHSIGADLRRIAPKLLKLFPVFDSFSEIREFNVRDLALKLVGLEGEILHSLDPAEFRQRIETTDNQLHESPRTNLERKHSSDFRSVTWHGRVFEFTPTQAACVKILWDAMEAGPGTLGEATIIEGAESSGNRLRDVFRNRKTRSMHEAWEYMIHKVGKGLYRLDNPKTAIPTKTP